jgi:4-amino-4-deoxy-L-arabinose transferase-like glycosyltransferase
MEPTPLDCVRGAPHREIVRPTIAMLRKRLLRSALFGFAVTIVAGVLALALALWIDSNPERSGRPLSGPLAIAADAVGYWELPAIILGHLMGPGPPMTTYEQEQRSQAVDVASVLSFTIVCWTLVIGAAHFVWVSRRRPL